MSVVFVKERERKERKERTPYSLKTRLNESTPLEREILEREKLQPFHDRLS